MDKELLEDFKSESMKDLSHAKELLTQFLSSPSENKLMQDVGACVDRVYGAAATLEIRAVSGLCQRMKEVCYLSSQVNNPSMTSIVAGTIISVLDYLIDLIKANRVLRGDNKTQSDMSHRLDLLISKFPQNLKRTIA